MPRMVRTIACLAVAFLICMVAVAADNPRDTVEKKVAKKTLPSIVRIGIPFRNDVRVIGSGFVIDSRLTKDGAVSYILTNEHVVEGEKRILVGLYDEAKQEGKKQWLDGEVVFQDKGNDLAVVKIETDKPLPELLLGPSSDLEVGEPAIVFGNPKGESYTVTRGIISRLRVPDERLDEKKNKVTIYMIQTDAAVNGGNSGGPMLNAAGEVVGIIELGYQGAEGLSYAITADRAQRVLALGMSAEKKDKVKHGVKAFDLTAQPKAFKETGLRQGVTVKLLLKDVPEKKEESAPKDDKNKAELIPMPKAVNGDSKPVPQGRIPLTDKDPAADKDAPPESKDKPKEKPAEVKKTECDCPLKKGDRVLKVEDRKISNAFDFERAFWGKKPGDKVEVTVIRDGKETKVTITVGGEPVEPEHKD